MEKTIAMLPGEGIGKEVLAQAEKVLRSVARHAWNGDDVVQFQGRVRRQFRSVGGFARKTALWRKSLPLDVDLPHLLHNFEQARSAGETARQIVLSVRD